MKAKYISYEETQAFSKLVLDYVQDHAFLRPFYSYRPDLKGLEQAFQNRQMTGSRETLVQVLKEQYQSLEPNKAVLQHIDLLANEQTFTVTTGHQLNLFTGPLYFIYKIVSTINLAIELKIAYPDKNFVPVYWMATEDHDFEEINHVHVEEKHISWIQQTNGATGRLPTKTVAAALMAYKGYLGISPNGQKMARMVDEAYAQHECLSDATRALVNGLFENYGLVIIDADHPSLKKQFAQVIQEDIIGQHSAKCLNSTSEALEKAGYKTQVSGRDINFFYLKENIRERIVFKNGKYLVHQTDIHFTEEELLSEITAHPERFSPNVIMRPLYQETILPNIAYIGGGAEVSYWMQLKGIFDHYGIDFPTLLLRNSALVIDKRSAENLHKLGFHYEDIFLPTEELQGLWIRRNSEEVLSLSNEIRTVQAVFDQIKLNAFKIDKTLENSTESTKIRATRLLERLEKKLFKAEKRRHQTSLQQIENVKKRLFPQQTLQERVVNIAPMYVAYGDDFISSLIENFDPLGGDFTLLIP